MLMSLEQLSPEEQTTFRKLRDDLRFYSRKCLKIVDKTGTVIDYEWNIAQEYIHNKLEAQLQELGYVRAIVVKGRQQGVSTYIISRFFHKCTFSSAKTVCIISHDAKSTSKLFDKVDFMYRHLPSHLKPEERAANRHEKKFDNESEYQVVTAGSDEAGRGGTAQMQHRSEEAFYEKADLVVAAAGQTVALVPGSEIIRETTGNGYNTFYKDVMEALAGRGRYIVIFVPWFWQTEYREKLEPGFQRTKKEQEYVDIYGLDDMQLMWRRNQIIELKSEKKFRQEYPFTLQEAFQASGEPFYDADLVAKARKSSIKAEKRLPLIMGVDPARKGDRTIIVLRRGREVLQIFKYDGEDGEMKQTRLAGICKNIIDQHGVDKCFIDYGQGYGTIDILTDDNYGDVVQGVYFSETPLDSAQFLNKRAEMGFAFKDWLEDGEVKLPDDDDMAVDIGSMPQPKESSTGRKSFPDKTSIKKAYGRSPDILDAIMLTFAYPVRSKEASSNQQTRTKNTSKGSGNKTLRTVRDMIRKAQGRAA